MDTPNLSTISGLLPVELMFTKKIRLVFDKLITTKNKKFKENNADITKFFKASKKIYFKEYKNGKVGWKGDIIEKQIGRLVYIIKHPKWIVKRHYNWTSAYFIIDSFKFSYEPYDIWMKWIQKSAIFFTSTFGPSRSYLQRIEYCNHKLYAFIQRLGGKTCGRGIFKFLKLYK